MRSIFKFLLLALVLVMVALVSALTSMRLAIHGGEVEVPKLIGLTPAEATRKALASGLPLEVESRFYSAAVPEGRIMSQVPDAGARVRRGWRVRVAESLGPQRVIIPDVVGQSSRAAEINIRRRGLDLGAIASARLPGFPADQVVAQSPPANAVGVSSPKINLLVAAPAEPEAFVMPDLVGKLLADATVTIESAGMKVGKVSSVALSAEPQPGGGAGANGAPAESAPPPSLRVSTVVRQNPPSGQKVVAGTTVSLEVVR